MTVAELIQKLSECDPNAEVWGEHTEYGSQYFWPDEVVQDEDEKGHKYVTLMCRSEQNDH